MASNDNDVLLEELFLKVSTLIRETPVTKELQTVSTDEKLRLYGLYKQATVGPCRETAPSMLAIEAHAKHNAWKACGEMKKPSAMLQYVEIASSQPHWLGAKCRTMLETFREQDASTSSIGVDSTKTDAAAENETTVPLLQQDSWLRQWCGWGPMQPRGQLDISYLDLSFAARQCLWPSTRPRYRRYEHAIRQQWRQATGRDAMVSLSARSLLDLYLLAKKYPKGSQIILAPGINVPGMLHVLRHHELEIVSIDLPQNESMGQTVMGVDVEAVAKAITSQTVAVMVTHAFGIIGAGEAEMRRLKHLCLEFELDFLEDCAECYTGLAEGPNCYKGSPHADLVLFSFGFIKTATALGGGVAVANRPELIDAMHQKQSSVYKDQTKSEFLRLVFAATLIRILCDVPLLYGFVFFCIRHLGLDFDAIVLKCVRGFPSATNESVTRLFDPVMARIRRRPCPSLLALLCRRLQDGSKLLPSVSRRIQQCSHFKLPSKNTSILTENNELRTHWLFPVKTSHPEQLCRFARWHGFDVTRGSSQLICTGQLTECPRAFALTESIVYLPITGCTLSTSSRNKLRAILDAPPEQLSIASKTENSWVLRVFDFRHVFPLLAVAWCFPLKAWTQAVLVSGYVCFSLLVGFVCVCIWIQRSMSSFYLNSSSVFAEYGKQVFRQIGDQCNFEQSSESSKSIILSTMDMLQLPTNANGRDRKIVLTGCTGFVGSALLRDLLLHRKQLGICKVILISRHKRGVSPQQRVDMLIEDPMFSFLSREEKADILEVVCGDVTLENAAIESSVLGKLRSDGSVSHIIHCAAAVSFTQSLEDAARANISSALYMQRLAGSFANKSAKFVHVSTAFVHGGESGTRDAPLDESLYSLGRFDAAEIYQSMTGTQFYAASAMRDLGFPNTYTFSKCVCEHLLARSSVETLIVRPSIVGPALCVPEEGWAGSKPSTLVAAACLYFAYQCNLWVFGDHVVPCIPVDVLSKFMVQCAFDERHVPNSLQSEDTMSSDDDFEKVSEPEISSTSTESVASSSHVKAAPDPGRFRIFNATWDIESNRTTQFTWVEYAVAVTQLGGALGKFSRPVALIGLFCSTKLLPTLKMSIGQYEQLHTFLVVYPFGFFLKLCSLFGQDTRHLKRLQTFLDLPLLFFPFMTRDFYFKSALVASSVIRGDEYLFSCTVAAYRFVDQQNASQKNDSVSNGPLSMFRIAGRRHSPAVEDLIWILTQPKGGLVIRLFAWVIIKILRMMFVEVTVDVNSFTEIAKMGSESGRIVLAPTHRSFFDFILLSFLLFSIPELQIDIPFIAAAAEFSHVPLINWLVRLGRAFFVRRNRGEADPILGDSIRRVYEVSNSPVFEVFMEGKRSRDRRFIEPKTGFLKCLSEHEKGKILVVPITVSYERIPEQEHLSREACSFRSDNMKLSSLLWWLLNCIQGKVKVGRAHISAGLPLEISKDFRNDFNVIANEIQLRQQKNVLVSSFHVDCGAKVLGIDAETLGRALQILGARKWDGCDTNADALELPQDNSELWTVFLQCSSSLGLLVTHRPQWKHWLSRSSLECVGDEAASETILVSVTSALVREFDAADRVVQQSSRQLKENGFDSPIDEHIFNVAERMDEKVPHLLLRAALSFVSAGSAKNENIRAPCFCNPSLAGSMLQSAERLGFWGYADSSFVVNLDSRGFPVVSLKGGRYRNEDNQIKGLVGFVERETGVKIDPMCEAFRQCHAPQKFLVTESCLDRNDMTALREAVPKVSTEDSERLRHGSGHAIDDVFHIRNGDQLRAPDIVVWPTDESEVESLIRVAVAKKWCIIPFGGGTNVSHATKCPPLSVEPRPIISMDVTLLNQVLWVDSENMLAHVQAGIRGGELVREMSRRGYTIGHEPDSIEFSTLGGWIATKASGMKRSKYGNIEDIVKGVSVVTPHGRLYHGDMDKNVWGRASTGLDVEPLMLGSEGCLGVITSAVIRIWPLPEQQVFEGILFADMSSGIDFVRDVARTDGELPASCRLLDNEHFRLGIALRSASKSVVRTVKSLLEKLVLRHLGFNEDECVCVTMTYEGSRQGVLSQKRVIKNLVRKHGGILMGQEAGKSGYDLTFLIAYLRDFALSFHLMGESFETFAPWSKTRIIIDRVKERVRKEHIKRCLPGEPFVGCRVTQLYNEGVCLYFYLCLSCHRVPNPTEVFSDIEKIARREILELGGSLSHHHGVGKIRAQFLPSLNSTTFQEVQKKIKESLDPLNIFGARNGVYADTPTRKLLTESTKEILS